jgi:hypothetical protein
MHDDPPSRGDNTRESQGAKQSQHKIARRGQHLRGVLTADSTGVLTERDVADVVEPVLDGPVILPSK